MRAPAVALEDIKQAQYLAFAVDFLRFQGRHQAEIRIQQGTVITQCGSSDFGQDEAMNVRNMRHCQYLPHHASIAQTDEAVARAILRRDGKIGERLRQVARSYAVFRAINQGAHCGQFLAARDGSKLWMCAET